MKPIFSVLAFLTLLISTANAQEFFRLKESTGMPLRTRSYTDLKGSPYFLDSWNKGIIVQANGQSYKDVELKYDQLEDELIFRDQQGRELGFAIPVKEFKINYISDGSPKSALFRNGFEPFKGSTEKNYYEILYDGPVKLAKKNVKRIEQYREYNSAVTTKSVIERVKYYFYTTNQLKEFKRDVKSIQLAFGEKSPTVLKYIDENKLDLKKDDDLVKIFSFFSTI